MKVNKFDWSKKNGQQTGGDTNITLVVARNLVNILG